MTGNEQNKMDFEYSTMENLMEALYDRKKEFKDGLYNSICKSLKNIKLKNDVNNNIWKVTIHEHTINTNTEMKYDQIIVETGLKTMYLKERIVECHHYSVEMFYHMIYEQGELPITQEGDGEREVKKAPHQRIYSKVIDLTNHYDEDSDCNYVSTTVKNFIILNVEKV